MSATRTDADHPTDRRPDRIFRSTPAEHRFRAATVDEALAQVRASLGEDAEIVEANRIRRGGIGGFFATELGVEVVARSVPNDESADVFEPFGDLRLGLGTSAAPAAPSPRAWTVDNGLDRGPDAISDGRSDARVVADPSMPAARARQAWRDATRPADSEPEARLPGFDQTSHADPASTPTTFAEHFLHELVQDAEQLRRSTDRNRVLPVRDAVTECTTDSDDVVPLRRRTAAMAAASAGAGATEPIGRPEPLTGTTTPPAGRAAAPAAHATPVEAAPGADTGPQTLPGMPAPAPKRRARRSGTGTTKSTAARKAAAAAEAAAAAAADAAAAAAAPDTGSPESPARAMIGQLIDQCATLTSSADPSVAPSKIALAVTLPDGSVMKVSIEAPRRAGRADAAGA